MKPSREIRNLVLGLYHDWSAGEPLEVFASSADSSFIGTGPGEFWIGTKAILAVMQIQDQEIGRPKITPGTIYAFEEGTVGWGCDECTIELPNGRALKTRFSFVFHREGSEWKMVHGHWSHEADNLEHWGTDLDLSMEAIAKLIEHDRPDLAPVTSPDGTVTIMFTDIEASTAVNESVGDDRFLPLLREHGRLLRERSEAHGGTIVKSQGDGFMLAFASARRGVECAVAVQRGLTDIDTPEIPLRVRMGLHTGEPVREADDFYGRDVAYAARVGAAAIGGEILVSSLVKSLVEPSGSFAFEGPRELDLKGFDGPQPIFAVLWR